MAHKPNTTLVTAGCDRGVSFDFVNPPLVRGSTILHESIEGIRERLRLGKLYRQTRQEMKAKEHPTVATTMYREMGMVFRLEQADLSGLS